MNHNITDLGIPAESELRGIGISFVKISAKPESVLRILFGFVLLCQLKRIFIDLDKRSHRALLHKGFQLFY